MTQDEFVALVEMWGADIARWPARYQDEARRFAETGEGQALLDAARPFDALFSMKPDISKDRAADAAFAVMQRIAAPRQRWTDRLGKVWMPRWWMPAGLACSMLVGVSLAVLVPPDRNAEQPEAVIDLVLDSGTAPFWSAP